MGEMQSTIFEDASEPYIDHLTTVRGHVRLEVTQANLQKFLPREPIEVLDIGGGSGRDAFWLAEQGHHVVMAEPGERMMHEALTNWHAAPEHIRQNVSLLQATDAGAVSMHGVQRFDLALSHGVMMYLDDPDEHLILTSLAIKQGGLLSLLTKGRDGLMQKLATNVDLDGMRQLQRTGKWQKNNLGEEVWVHSPEDIARKLEDLGFSLLDWFGVRLISDGITEKVENVDPDWLSEMVELEIAASRDEHRRRNGQMLHFVAQKN